MDEVVLLHFIKAGDEYADSAFLIGVYRSEQAARAAISRLASQSGFRDYPEGFQCQTYELDKDHWTEGFITVSD